MSKFKKENKIMSVVNERPLYTSLKSKYQELTLLQQDIKLLDKVNKSIVLNTIETKKSKIMSKMLEIERYIEEL